MRNIASLAVLVTTLSIMSGCATKPIATSEASPVPTERVLDAASLQRAPNTGEVTIKRDTGFAGSACSTRIFANAKPVADINPGEKVAIYLPEGDHIISALPNAGCGGGLVETKVGVKIGGSYTYRVGSESNMSFGIFPTAF